LKISVRNWTCACVCAAAAVLTLPTRAGSQAPTATRVRTGEGGAAIVLGVEPATAPSLPDTAASDPVASYWAYDRETGGTYRRDRLLVRFREDAPAIARAQALRVAAADRSVQPLWDGWVVSDLGPAAPVLEARTRLARNPAVAEVELDYRVTAFTTRPNDEFYRIQWNFEAIDMPRAWDINNGGSPDVVIAVIDTGLNTVGGTFTFTSPFVGQFALQFAEAPDLVAPGRIVSPRDFVYRDDTPLDLSGHGTHVAGTIAQITGNTIGVAGIAHNARIMPIKVLAESIDDLVNPSNPGGLNSTTAAAIRYAADNGAKVINLSLGGPAASTLLREAIQYAVTRGAFVSIAAGNSGDEGNPVEYPAAYGGDIAGAMTVGAVGPDLKRAAYSAFKPYVEICAPGGDAVRDEADTERGVSQMTYRSEQSFWFLDPGQMAFALRAGFRPRFDTFSVTAANGTSMAAPHVSGVAALLYSQGIKNPADIEAAIKRFARPIDARQDECGAGLVDPRRALRGLGLSQ
jgi:serine protease